MVRSLCVFWVWSGISEVSQEEVFLMDCCGGSGAVLIHIWLWPMGVFLSMCVLCVTCWYGCIAEAIKQSAAGGKVGPEVDLR